VRVCLITAHHVSVQPRIVREADTLSAAGFAVRVVARQTDPELCALDHKLLESRPWQMEAVKLVRNGDSHQRWLKEAVATEFSKKLFEVGLRNQSLAARAYVRGASQLADIAAAQSADWYIAHTQAALPAAALAARRWDARLGFDCEDLLAEMGSDPPELVQAIESTYLQQCDYISVPSTAIATRLREQYLISEPTVLYNVFPAKLASSLLHPDERRLDGPLKLHWFGQTMGSGRGLEQVIQAAKELNEGVEFHLRGRLSESYRSELLSSADGSNLRLIFHPLLPHDELINSFDQFHVGIASEVTENGGYARTATNKVFSYLLAGLAIAASATQGQQEIMEQTPRAGFIYADLDQLAAGLKRFARDREALREAQIESWKVAREKFCWDVEQEKFLGLLNENPLTQSRRDAEAAWR
jgi:glycosyltransferase involved in cell wall biosynthesis